LFADDLRVNQSREEEGTSQSSFFFIHQGVIRTEDCPYLNTESHLRTFLHEFPPSALILLGLLLGQSAV